MGTVITNKPIKSEVRLNTALFDFFSMEGLSDLSKEEREKLESGNGFIVVPKKEIKRLRIEAYSYLV